MQSLRWPLLGGHGREAPPIRPRPIRWTKRVLLGVAMLSLLSSGCASLRNPCGNGLFSRCNLFRGGLFQRDTIVATPIITESYGEPFLAVPPDAAPLLSPVEVLPAPALELTPAPADSEMLEPISSRSSPNQKTLYETLKPPGGTTSSRRGGPESTRSLPDPTLASDQVDPLLDLPPLAVTIQAEPVETPPAPPAADGASTVRSTLPTDLTTPAPDAASAELPPKAAESRPISVAPGIARFKVVEPQLAGGSLPNPAGWSFLADKGYRTVLDLRERSEVQSGDDAAALHAGLRYVALPMTPNTINDILLERFEDEISLAGGRPLYFFDEDGARPAVLWFLNRVATDGVDVSIAAREVEELGPKVAEYWQAAHVFLQGRQAAEAARATQPPVSVPVAPPLAPLPTLETVAPSGVAPEASLSTSETVAAATPTPGGIDETKWRPFAAMILTSLSLPLAFFGRSMFSTHVGRRLASLPAPGRRRLSLPSKSDA